MVSGLPEVVGSRGRAVNPWLAALTILEPTVGATDGDVEDEIELLVEWSLLAASGGPDVLKTGSVGVGQRELTTLPEWLVKVGVENLEETRVDVGEEVLLRPLETKGVRLCSVGGVKSRSLDVGPPPSIVGQIRTPMESGGDDVVTTLLVGVVVTTRFGDIDLTRQGPGTIGVLDRQHPDGGPEPVTLRHLGGDLDTTVLDGGTLLGVDATRLDGRNDLARGGVGLSNAILLHIGRADAITGQVDDGVGVDQGSVLEGRLDDELAVLHKDVFVGDGGLLKLTIAAELLVRNACLVNSPRNVL